MFEQLIDSTCGAPPVDAAAFRVVAEARELLLQGEYVRAGVAGADLAVEGRACVQRDDGPAVHGQQPAAGFDRVPGLA